MIDTVYRIPGLFGVPSASLSLALLGDFHNGNAAPILSSLQQYQPDMICIAGDLVYNKKPPEGMLMVEAQENVLPLLRGCCEIAPTYMSLGNHEANLTEADFDMIRSTGTVVLDNAWHSTNIRGYEITIGGLTSHYVLDARAFKKTYPDYDKHHQTSKIKWAPINEPDITWIEPAQQSYTLLLSHHPEYFSNLPSIHGIVLSAHAHGGQIRLFNHGLFAPGQGWWPKYTKGVYSCPGSDQKMVVTAGLTNTASVPRICNPTEIVYLVSQSK